MLRGLQWLGLLVMMVVVIPTIGADDKKKDEKKPGPPEEKKKSDKKPATGDEKKSAEKKSPAKAKAHLLENVVILQVADGRMGKVDDPQKLGVKLAYVDGKDIKYLDKEVEVPRSDDLVVRTANLPPAFDDKGRPRRYTKKEMDELRGTDRRLPGYAADVDSLKPEQTIRVFMGKKKTAPKNEPPAIVMILIISEPPS